MNGQNTVAVEGFTEGAHDESLVCEENVSHKDPIWSTHAAVIIKYARTTLVQPNDSRKDHVTGQQFAADERTIHTKTT